jgi:hypothetical protein
MDIADCDNYIANCNITQDTKERVLAEAEKELQIARDDKSETAVLDGFQRAG